MKYSDDFKQENNVMAIIDRYKQLKKNQEEFMANFEHIENEKEAVNREIIRISKQIAEENYTFSSQINDLKSYVEDMYVKIRNMKQGYEGDLGKKISDATDYAQVVIAIQNIHNLAVGTEDPKYQTSIDPQDKDSITTSLLTNKITVIKERIKILLEVLKDVEKPDKPEKSK